ncbi:MAG: PHP domain-containing protein [Solobacterium sp.]|nr:PHP domain-containing protein [Solobacterium sp.]
MDTENYYRYETHCHTSPVSNCGRASVQETVRFYKEIGYDGIFLTNHFLDGNINIRARSLPYEEQVDYYYSDYEQAAEEGKKIGLKVFPGTELSYKGTDFLIYGLDKEWYRAHPEIMKMTKTEELGFLMQEGAFVVQAHPYREAHYIDHIRLFPRVVHAAEIINSHQPPLANEMAQIYADRYGLLKTCGSDNHVASAVFEGLKKKGLEPEIAGMCSLQPVGSVQDYIRMVCSGEMKPFLQKETGEWRLFEPGQ